MNLEDLLKTAVDDGVRSVPPGFTDGAIRRARRQRRNTRIAVAGGVAAFALAAAAVAVVDPADPRTEAPPAGETPDLAPRQPNVVIDLGALASGPEPAIPWFRRVGAVYVGPEDAIIADSVDAQVLHVNGGVVVMDTAAPDEPYVSVLKFYPAGGGGESVELARGALSRPVVSPDGTRAAWRVGDPGWAAGTSDLPESEVTSTLVLADATTGEVLEELPDAPGSGTRPMGYLDDDTLLVEVGGNTVSGLYTWDPGDGLTPFRDATAVDAVSPGGDLLALSGSGGNHVVDTGSGETLWTVAAGQPLTFSPDGRYLAVLSDPVSGAIGPRDLVGARPGDVVSRDGREVTVTQELLDTAARYPDGWERIDHLVIHDARTGAELLRIEGEFPEVTAAWESDDRLVFDAYRDGAEAALVRCTVDGECELATEIQALDDDADTYDIPYRIAQ